MAKTGSIRVTVKETQLSIGQVINSQCYKTFGAEQFWHLHVQRWYDMQVAVAIVGFLTNSETYKLKHNGTVFDHTHACACSNEWSVLWGL